MYFLYRLRDICLLLWILPFAWQTHQATAIGCFSLHFLHRHSWHSGPKCLFRHIFLNIGALGTKEWETLLRVLSSSFLDLRMFLDSVHTFLPPFSLLYLVFPSLSFVCCAVTNCSPCFQSFSVQAPSLFSFKTTIVLLFCFKCKVAVKWLSLPFGTKANLLRMTTEVSHIQATIYLSASLPTTPELLILEPSICGNSSTQLMVFTLSEMFFPSALNAISPWRICSNVSFSMKTYHLFHLESAKSIFLARSIILFRRNFTGLQSMSSVPFKVCGIEHSPYLRFLLY